VDTATAADTLPGATTFSMRQSRPVLGEGVAPAAQLDRALEAPRHGSSTVVARSRGARSAWLKQQSDSISSLRGVAWWPAGQCWGTARGGEVGDTWVAAPVAGAAVLDITCEQQQSGFTRWKSRAGSKWGASGETWFLLDVKAGIWVVVDKAEHVASEAVASVGLW
jgi:hypothetical protein